MSSIQGEQWAVVSVGASCQTSHQIFENLEFLKELTGDESLRKASCPLDWQNSPTDSVIRMFEQNRFFPDSPDELTLNIRAKWVAMGNYFWHDFTHKPNMEVVTREEVLESFDEMASKYRHKVENFKKAQTKPNLWLIHANEQRNIELHHQRSGGDLDPTVRTSQLHALRKAIAKNMGRDFYFLAITSEDRYVRDTDEGDLLIEFIEPDENGESPWEGNQQQWQSALKRAYGRMDKVRG